MFVISYVIATVIVFMMFGLTVLMSPKVKNQRAKGFLFQMWGLILCIPLILIYPEEIKFFGYENIFDITTVCFILLAIVPTSVIMFFSDKKKPSKPFKWSEFSQGASMEIPQRLLVQNLFVVLCNYVIWGEYVQIGIILNALLWAQFIILQAVMNEKVISKTTIIEVCASMWFSIVVGILYYITGNIMVAMFTHGAQRFVKHRVKIFFGDTSLSETYY